MHRVSVYPWEISKLRMLLIDEFYLAIYVNDVDHDVVETVVIKTMHDGKQPACNDKRKVVEKNQILYPALDNYQSMSCTAYTVTFACNLRISISVGVTALYTNVQGQMLVN